MRQKKYWPLSFFVRAGSGVVGGSSYRLVSPLPKPSRLARWRAGRRQAAPLGPSSLPLILSRLALLPPPAAIGAVGLFFFLLLVVDWAEVQHLFLCDHTVVLCAIALAMYGGEERASQSVAAQTNLHLLSPWRESVCPPPYIPIPFETPHPQTLSRLKTLLSVMFLIDIPPHHPPPAPSSLPSPSLALVRGLSEVGSGGT